MIFEPLAEALTAGGRLSDLCNRLWRSAVVWSWGFTVLRVASGLVLLPLLVSRLPVEELGFYYLFVSIFAFSAVMDFGLLNGIDRFVIYAMGGAVELKPIGLAADPPPKAQPNYSLIWKLLYVTRRLYVLLTLILVLLLGSVGTFLVQLRILETQNPGHTWLAWGLTLLSAAAELYSGWWNVFLRGMNQVLLMTRIYVTAYAVRLVLAASLLFIGGGLLSVPAATIVSALLLRYLARKHCLATLLPHAGPAPTRPEMTSLLKTVWPNSWRSGAVLFSGFLTNSANGILCMGILGLAANAQYGLSVQLISFIQGMALAWMSVKWPLIGQHRARGENAVIRRVFWQRLHLQIFTFMLMTAMIIPLAPYLLKLLNTDKTLLATPWLVLLAFNTLLDLHLISWATLITTTNRIPFVAPIVASNAVSFILAVVLLHFAPWGAGGLIIAPLLVGSLLNYWYWPKEGAKTLDTSWVRFVFSRPV